MRRVEVFILLKNTFLLGTGGSRAVQGMGPLGSKYLRFHRVFFPIKTGKIIGCHPPLVWEILDPPLCRVLFLFIDLGLCFWLDFGTCERTTNGTTAHGIVTKNVHKILPEMVGVKGV